MLMANRGALRKQRKRAFDDFSFHMERFIQLQTQWKFLIIFLQITLNLNYTMKVI